MSHSGSVGTALRRAAPIHGRLRALPLWARWNRELDQPYTLGLEEEVMLLEPSSWSLAQSSDGVLSQLSGELSGHTAAETHACVIELITGIHGNADDAVA